MELTTMQQQRQILSQQMIQSAGILQMTVQELYTYLQEVALENPVMEIHMPSASGENPDFTSCLHQRSIEEYRGLSASDESNRYLYQQQEQDGEYPMDWRFRKNNQPLSLADALWEQLVSIPFRPKDEKTLKYMLASLDSWGYLREPLEQIGQKFSQEPQRMEQLLSVLQALDPPGVGARTISECLLLQLKRQMDCPAQLEVIVTDCLDLLAKNQIPTIAKKVGISVKEASRLCQIIRSLNPKPGAAYSNEDIPRYIQPDVFIRQKNGEVSIQLNEALEPQISINQYYHQLSKTTDEEEVQKYLLDKLHQLEWIRTCIAQRNETLCSTVSAILNRQKDFFQDGPAALKPLRLCDIAEELGIHESTVSRAVRNKYLQCSQGIYPLSYFFSTSLTSQKAEESAEGEKISAKAAKAALKKLIGEEDKKKPLSDRQLAEKLEETGISISRRTVAKYREEMEIGEASRRKIYE
ncbi:MAG: RNA polymerase factor sigma-54 [Lachnospiraceae bacterium]|nr:RNA polymerase factor sigma-54 [Lachnospiraceae bacterium]